MIKTYFYTKGRNLELKASRKFMMEALRCIKRERFLIYLTENSSYIEEIKKTRNGRIRIKDKDKIKEFDFGCLLDFIVKSKTSIFFLL